MAEGRLAARAWIAALTPATNKKSFPELEKRNAIPVNS
jgi:hypothetical protein